MYLAADARFDAQLARKKEERKKKMSTLKESMERLPKTRRKKVEARAEQLIAEEMSLQDLRKAMAQTQERVAKTLGIKQENVSRIEQRTDLLISTLRGYVEAMGGKPPVPSDGLWGEIKADLSGVPGQETLRFRPDPN